MTSTCTPSSQWHFSQLSSDYTQNPALPPRGQQVLLSQINNLLNVTDKQDVTMMLNLMQLIWSLLPPLPTDKPNFCETHTALNQHAKLLRYLILPYINVNLSLFKQLKFLSAAAHLMYILYTHQNMHSSYLPSPLYHDIQIMVKNVFFCVTKAK